MRKIVTNDDERLYGERVTKLVKDTKHFGRMNAPTSSAYIKGPCGDEMEFYLVIKDKIIEEVKFYTEGCITTRICGSMTAQLALGKTVEDALGISPRKVIDLLKGLSENERHCSILAVSTLYKAIVDYLLAK
ncbi:MAG: iron-sulfur cluster assembly scaffold protein [Candidatus Omnitrophica bacterium]|nr:iron-sulfur cluster assembly scaffold protein [Candidatus Omnitrophota bacterium]